MRLFLSRFPIRNGIRLLSSGSPPVTEAIPPIVRMDTNESGIHVITMNNDARANCLSLPMLKELRGCLKQLRELKNVRAVIIRGTERFFSAGHDLSELVGEEEEEKKTKKGHSPAKVFTTCAEFMMELNKLPMPTIAAVNGPAHAAGCQLVCTCDLAVAGQSATFAVPGVKLGLFCTTPGVALTRAIGSRAAKELLFTGQPISATRSYELGMVHKVVPDNQVYEAALNLAKQIARHSSPVVRMGKQALQTQASMELSDAYDVATQVMLENLGLEDTQRGIRAFLDKKPMPTWSDESD